MEADWARTGTRAYSGDSSDLAIDGPLDWEDVKPYVDQLDFEHVMNWLSMILKVYLRAQFKGQWRWLEHYLTDRHPKHDVHFDLDDPDTARTLIRIEIVHVQTMLEQQGYMSSAEDMEELCCVSLAGYWATEILLPSRVETSEPLTLPRAEKWDQEIGQEKALERVADIVAQICQELSHELETDKDSTQAAFIDRLARLLNSKLSWKAKLGVLTLWVKEESYTDLTNRPIAMTFNEFARKLSISEQTMKRIRNDADFKRVINIYSQGEGYELAYELNEEELQRWLENDT